MPVKYKFCKVCGTAYDTPRRASICSTQCKSTLFCQISAGISAGRINPESSSAYKEEQERLGNADACDRLLELLQFHHGHGVVAA